MDRDREPAAHAAFGGVSGTPSHCLDPLVLRLEIFQRPQHALGTLS